jgi:hypothetical protein
MSVTHEGKRPPACFGERCGFRVADPSVGNDRCGKDATHKVGEEFLDENVCERHNMTQYVCCLHFGAIFGLTCK